MVHRLTSLVAQAAVFTARILLAILLGVGVYVLVLLGLASLSIHSSGGKALLPLVVLMAIALACVTGVAVLRWTKPRRPPAGPESPWDEEDAVENSPSSATPR